MQIRPEGSTQSRIMIVQDCPGYEELRASAPLQGSAGKELNRMLHEAGITRSECFVTSLIRTQIPFNSFDRLVAQRKADVTLEHVWLHDKKVLPSLASALQLLEKEIDLIKPKVILALGNGVLFSLLGKWGIKSWRGSELEYTSPKGHICRVVPAYPPSYILQVWKDRQITVSDLRRVKSLADGTQEDTMEYQFIIRPSFSEGVRVLNDLLRRVRDTSTTLSVDIETRAGHIACTGIAWSKTEAICIPQMTVNAQNGCASYWLEEEETYITYLLYQLLTHPNAVVIGQNFLYDAQYFYRWFHFIPNLKRDTMIGHHSMWSNLPKGLDYLSSMYCKKHIYWKAESKNWDPKLGEAQLWEYNCKDCCITFEVDEAEQLAIEKLLPTWPQLREVHDFQQELFWPVLETMIAGLRTDTESTSALAIKLQSAIDEREAWIEYVVGHPLNIRSPKQMCDFFYRELAQPPVKSRKTGNPTCDDSALERIGLREPLLLPLLSKIAELRSLGVFLSTFIEAPLDTDGRMRCSFNITGTNTYRFSSSENAFGSGMNLQNIPKGDEVSNLPNVRDLFIPDPDHLFFDIDLDSADLRIVVWESDCREMKQMFAEGLKPYVEVAKEYHHDPSITKHHPSYKLFKALCHGTNYLGTPSGLSSRIGLLSNEVERIQKWYYSKFPEIRTWQDNIISQVNTRRYVENVFGYRMHFFDRIEGTIYNQAVAWVPQSTVACLINRGYKNLYEQHRDISVLLQVHDSLGGQFPTRLGDAGIEAIARACSVPLPYPEPLIIPVGIKSSDRSWGDCG